MKLVFAARALREIERCARWWLAHRDEKSLFADELDEALDRIRKNATVGPVYRVVDGREQRRVLMPKTAHHIYYRVDPEQIVILAVWGARRLRAPR